MAESFGDKMESWYKMIGPAFLTLVLFSIGIGAFIYKMYAFNIENNIVGAFPSQFTINLFFIFAMSSAFFIVVIIALQNAVFAKEVSKK